jgi:pSer/pThr/pTyr-binding forkhead associated (FHA) protein
MASFSLNSAAPSSTPRLEFVQGATGELHRVTIEQTPFKIGRGETCDLKIDSAQVSREHAQIYQRGGIWSIRDLGSTNGTQVNGKPVRESFLADGDILLIAETELTFVVSSVTPFQRMATQPIKARPTAKLPAILPAEISQMRAATEAVLWQAIPLESEIAVSLHSGQIEACFVRTTQSPQQGEDFVRSHAAGKYYRELARRLSLEMADAGSSSGPIFVPTDISDFEATNDFFASLRELRNETDPNRDVGVSISLPEVEDTGALDQACREIHTANTRLALINFQGSSSQVLELASCCPDYLVLCSKLLKGVGPTTPAMRRLELVLTTCQQLGIKAVLPACTDENTIAECEKIGYEFAIQTRSAAPKLDHHSSVCLVT